MFRARAQGIEIIGDVELFAREIRVNPELPGKAPVIAITVLLVAAERVLHMGIFDPVVSLPQVRAGTIKAFAVLAPTRSPAAAFTITG